MDGGKGRAEALRYLVRLLTRGLSSASDTEVQQRLANFVVTAGTPFSERIIDLCGVVSSLQQLGLQLVFEDGLPLAMKAPPSNQHPSFGMAIFMDRAHLSRPFVSVAAGLGCLDDLDENTICAQASSRSGQAKTSGAVRSAANPGTTGMMVGLWQ